MQIYTSSCTTCGINGVYLRMVKSWANKNNIVLEILESKYDNKIRQKHAQYLQQAGLNTDTYPTIIVDSSGKVTRIDQWKP